MGTGSECKNVQLSLYLLGNPTPATQVKKCRTNKTRRCFCFSYLDFSKNQLRNLIFICVW
jgi:hypothetical protein